MVKIGLVGLGGMGTVHWNNYKYIRDCEVVAATGTSENDEKNAKAWNLPLFSDVEQMLDHVEVDVIDICTPTFLHYQHAVPALSRGVHVIIEKPMALHKTDAFHLYEIAEKNRALLFVGQVLRFSKGYQVLKMLVETKRYGKPLDASFERLSAVPRWAAGGWMFDKHKSGHLAFDLHIHDLDLIISIFGKPSNYTYTSAGNKDKEYKEQYRFTYQYEDYNISAEAAWFNADIPFTARWRVYFENAVVVNDGKAVIAYQIDHEPYIFDTEETNKIPTGINVPPTEMYLNELNHFISCIKDDKKSDIIKKEEIFDVLEILEEISFGN